MKGISTKKAARTERLRKAIEKGAQDLKPTRAVMDVEPTVDVSNKPDNIGPAYGFKVADEEKKDRTNTERLTFWGA